MGSIEVTKIKSFFICAEIKRWDEIVELFDKNVKTEWNADKAKYGKYGAIDITPRITVSFLSNFCNSLILSIKCSLIMFQNLLFKHPYKLIDFRSDSERALAVISSNNRVNKKN